MKKCLVLDLDNTLWGGVIGEDGIDNIALALTPPGNSFVAFQQAISDHYDRGVILAINSRNNPEDALQVIRTHPNMILKEHHFAAMRINWNDKAQNLRELAQELNIGLDSMVFLDDDQTNRELVRALVPEVEVPDLPTDFSKYTQFLNSLDYFPKEAVTDEDKMRGNLYVTERLRKEEEKAHASKEEFLASLNLELHFYEDDKESLSRLSQMTDKTNQFNIDKQPFTEAEISSFIDSSTHKVFHAKLSDKFGDYGIVIFAMVHITGSVWHIQSLLMSCRVFGRYIEDAFLSELLKRAFKEGAERVTINFRETEKNMPARDFIQSRFADKAILRADAVKAPTWVNIHNQRRHEII